jgi:cell division protein ZapA (FtsZ GTPase activity inhibitor)
MSILTITLAGKPFKLACPEESRSHIEMLAEKLDLELDDVSKGNPSASFELMLVMSALSLMDDKQSKAKESGGKALEKANADSQKQLSSIFEELKIVANKF